MDVNQIFKDLAVMVHDQGDIIGGYMCRSCDMQSSCVLISLHCSVIHVSGHVTHR